MSGWPHRVVRQPVAVSVTDCKATFAASRGPPGKTVQHADVERTAARCSPAHRHPRSTLLAASMPAAPPRSPSSTSSPSASSTSSTASTQRECPSTSLTPSVRWVGRCCWDIRAVQLRWAAGPEQRYGHSVLTFFNACPARRPHAGNSPVQIHKRQFAGIVDRWFNLSIAIKQVCGACRGGLRPVACAVQACMHADNVSCWLGQAGAGSLLLLLLLSRAAPMRHLFSPCPRTGQGGGQGVWLGAGNVSAAVLCCMLARMSVVNALPVQVDC